MAKTSGSDADMCAKRNLATAHHQVAVRDADQNEKYLFCCDKTSAGTANHKIRRLPSEVLNVYGKDDILWHDTFPRSPLAEVTTAVIH